ncbi:MAG: hypothetical protein LUH22_01400 [Bacteroides sp.]|nr:hypothetical protein [Bacteroides sp.]
MISTYSQNVSRHCDYTPSRPVNTSNKKVDFDVDFDDGKFRETKAEQNIEKKDSIQTKLFPVAKILK